MKVFFFSSRRRHTRYWRDWSSDVCSSDLPSLYEGLPVIGIEAQASGVPCLFSDTITKEVDVCNVTFLPINGNLDLWSNSISNLVSFKRIDVSAIVSKKKYDIRKEGERMIEFYKRCINY